MSRFPPLALCALVALGGCHAHKSGASSADSHAPGTTTASVAADCGKYPQGAPGVIRTFCNGTAVVKLSVGGVAHALSGGSCQIVGNIFTLNLGVVSGPGLAGPKPDYIGMTAPTADGPFTNATLTLTVGGKGYTVAENSGEITGRAGSFAGKAATGEAIEGAFTC